ncbi:hypothetical protein [Lentibacillus salicampi]|uniref:Lipoprotein n=1 Tax=Lentibacillus salicampi TaxID=175306 RepID=A0A4Y9ABN3_9BACI|nr:hypothetical protein [Lentibacillus salicampi]TFJ92340.1 hypothetical protein E4U82_12870 [Lentibacillus salicampi]
MRKFKVLFYFAVLLLVALVFTACQDSESKEANKEHNESAVETETDENSSDTEKDESENPADTDDIKESESNHSSNESENDESNTTSSKTKDEPNDEDVDLSQYSSEEIEYARIWHQLGPNPEIDKLYVIKKSAGTPLRPKHEDVSATYPEDVIMLKGTRIVDGAVTYSGNGDGTINVYKVPARWNEKLVGEVDKEEIKNATEDIAQNTDTVEIEPFANEEIINYIEKIERIETD